MKTKLLFCLVAGCYCLPGQAQSGAEVVSFSKFPEETRLVLKTVFRMKEPVARRMFLVDSLLYIWDEGNLGDYVFYRYSSAGQKLSGGLIEAGQGYGQITGAMSAGVIQKNKIWVHDVVLDKLVTAELLKNKAGKDSTVLKEYRLPRFFYSVQLATGNRLLGAGAQLTPSKVEELDLVSGKDMELYGAFDKEPAGVPFGSWKHAQEGFLFLKPAGEKMVLASRFSDRIEIFDLATQTSKLIKGPENFDFAFEPFQTAGVDVSVRTDKTRFAFSNGAVTDGFIYLLYSGKQHETDRPNDNETIYVYSWDGKPVKKLNLDRPVMSFTVSDDDTVLYAYDRKAGVVMSVTIH